MKRIFIIFIMACAVASSLTIRATARPLNFATRGTILSALNSQDDGITFGVRRDRLTPTSEAPRAPEFAAGEWINSNPTRLEDLRGRVVLLDFWSFNCFYCRNAIPSLRRLNARYRSRGLTVVGIHTGMNDRAKQTGLVRRHTRALQIRYPVVTDHAGETWRAYDMQAWPSVVIIDKQGRVRFVHIGDGMYEEQERIIQQLLAE